MTLKIEIDVTEMSDSEVFRTLNRSSASILKGDHNLNRESMTVLVDDDWKPCGSMSTVETLFGVPIGSDPR